LRMTENEQAKHGDCPFVPRPLRLGKAARPVEKIRGKA
jgi:hypothetical protein